MKQLLSIITITGMLIMASVSFTSCEQESNEPTTAEMLVGAWEEPQGEGNLYTYFRSNGEGFTESTTSPQKNFTYSVNGNTITIVDADGTYAMFIKELTHDTFVYTTMEDVNGETITTEHHAIAYLKH